MSRPRISTTAANKYASKYGADYNAMETLLDLFSVEMETKLADVVKEKLAIEQRFVSDYRQYLGRYPDSELSSMDGRSSAFINLTAPKSDIGRSQLGDMLFPNDDSNYGISPTPVPELAEALDDDTPVLINGQQQQLLNQDDTPRLNEDGTRMVLTEGIKARRIMEVAAEKSQAMKLLIDDQLTQADYEDKGRRVLFDGTVMGTGILKGPFPSFKTELVRSEDGESTVPKSSVVPDISVVRPWNYFPEMSAATVKEASFVFERFYVSEELLKSLVLDEVPGVIPESISKIIHSCGANKSHHGSSSLDDLRALEDMVSVANDSNFEAWEYNGAMPKKVYEAFAAEHGLPELDNDNDLVILPEVCVKMCAGMIYQILPKFLDRKKGELYHVWNWSRSEFSQFGYGLPHKMSDAQDAINTAWRQMQDNAALTVGSQIAIRKGKVEPVDGDWTFRPNKLWHILSGVSSIREAFETFEFPSHQNELANIYTLARQFFDEESGVPMIAAGEQGQYTQTLGGMSMLMNAANTVRRDQVRNYDDRITKPLITAIYHYNMEYHKDPSVKGDSQVDARGVSALMVKEQQQKALLELMNLANSNQVFAPVVQLKALNWLRSYVSTLGLGKDMLPTESELRQFIKQQMGAKDGASEPTKVETLQLEYQLKAQLESLKHQNAERLKLADQKLELYKMQREERISVDKFERELEKIALREAKVTEREAMKETAHQVRFNTELQKAHTNIGLETQS